VSDKEKKLAAMVSTFPPDLQDKFLNQAAGAAMALDTIGIPRPEDKEASKSEP
jgi:hypothetical protein